MKQKKILFVCNNLNHGGIPRALVNLLQEIAGSCEIDLLLFYPSGSYLTQVPESVRILHGEGLLPLLGIPQADLQRTSKPQALLRAILVAMSRLLGNSLARRIVYASVPELSGYDAAVSFVQDNSDHAFAVGCNDYVLRKVKAARKIAFVHCDFEHYGGNTPGVRESYRQFDRIACVSEGCREAFLHVLPELADRTLVVENCTDYGAVRAMADAADESVMDKGVVNRKNRLPENVESQLNAARRFRMVTVARMNPEKGCLRALPEVSVLMEEYPALTWELIGDGPDRATMEAAVQTAGLSERIRFYGMKDNPYPYVKRAGLFFLPSIHEAAPMVFEEARALGVPVLTTRTLSAQHMVADRKSGWVCENSAKGIHDGLRFVLEHPEAWLQMRDSLPERPFDNTVSHREWEELIG